MLTFSTALRYDYVMCMSYGFVSDERGYVRNLGCATKNLVLISTCKKLWQQVLSTLQYSLDQTRQC